MFSVGFLLICLWTSAIAGTPSSVANATGSNASAISVNQLPFGINMSDLPKSMRNISTIQTILASHPKMRVTNVGAKHNKTVIVANTTDTSKTGSDVTLPTTLRNLTQNIKNGGHRSSSSRLLDRLASKVSLVSLTSSKVSDVTNKTSTLRNERASVNATLIELKNATDRINKTIEKRSVHNATMTDRASSFFQALPAMLANTTSNVTSWAKRLFGADSDSSRNAATKKVTRDTTAAELKALVNTSALNSTSTDKLRSTAAVAAKKVNSSSLLNLTATIVERDIRNLTADIPKVKGSNSSAVNSTSSAIKRGSEIVEVIHKKQQDSTVEGEQKVVNLTREMPEKEANSSLIAKSSTSLNNRTRRHSNGRRGGYNVPSRPSYMMPPMASPSTPASPGYTTPGRAPVYGMPPAAASQTYAPAYGTAPVAFAPAYGMAMAPAAATYTTPAPAAPAYGMAPAAPAYGMAPAAPTYTTSAPATPAPVYGMPPAAPGPAYGMAPAAPAYGMAPAAPIYTTPAPATPAPAYGMAPAASAPAYGMAPAAPAYGMAQAAPTYTTPAPATPAPAYGMAPAASAPAYGMVPAPLAPSSPAPAPAYGMAPGAPAYGMAPAATIYTTPAPVTAPAYEQTTESYYTAPVPAYTTNVPYNLQPTPSPYGVSPPPVYPAQPYGSMPSRPSATASPWY